MNRNPPSIGCELQPVMIPALPDFRREGLISHIQVTVPNTLTYFQARESTTGVPVIAHCNLLNTFGRNEWSELRPWARQIRALNPIHVVEHFTAFRHRSGEKSGVSFDPALAKGSARQSIIDAIRKWQDCLGVPLCLENIPLARDVESYFDFLLDVKVETGCEIACDLPHFFLSVFSAGLSPAQTRELARRLDPVQLHVGGLSLSPDGLLRDNHKLFSPWILSEGRALFPGAAFVTLEQNHQIPAETIAMQLRAIRDGEVVPVPAHFSTAKGVAPEDANIELARDAARSSHYPEPSTGNEVACRGLAARRHEDEACSLLALYDKYLPFFSPLSVLESEVECLSAAELVRAAASMSQWSLSYLSWWNPEQADGALAAVRYGEGDRVCFERRFGAGDSAKSSEIEETYRFSSKRGFWVEVTSPKLRISERDRDEKMEGHHDARAV